MNSEDLLGPVMAGAKRPGLDFSQGQCCFRMASVAGTVSERMISAAAVCEAATGIRIDSGWFGPEVVRNGNGRAGEWAVAFIPPGRHELELTAGTPGIDETVERITAP